MKPFKKYTKMQTSVCLRGTVAEPSLWGSRRGYQKISLKFFYNRQPWHCRVKSKFS